LMLYALFFLDLVASRRRGPRVVALFNIRRALCLMARLMARGSKSCQGGGGLDNLAGQHVRAQMPPTEAAWVGEKGHQRNKKNPCGPCD
jgi:hypothetical protein